MAERKLVLGRAGTGKTRLVLNFFQEHLLGRGTGKALFILPTASQAEHVKDLLLRPGRLKGIIDTDITNFASLARYYFMGRNRGRALGEAEKYLLLQRLLKEEEFKYFSSLRNYPGFLTGLKSLIKEVKENLLTSQELKRLLNRADKGEQYPGLAILYRRYQDALTRNELWDDEDILTALASELKGNAQAFKGLELLVVDGFNDYTPVEWEILTGLISRASRAFVTLTWEEAERARELFAASKATCQRLVALGFDEVRLGEPSRSASGTLKDLEANLFTGKRGVVSWDGSVKVLEAADILDEVEEIAREIKSLIGDQGYQYRDIGIICRDLAEYADLIQGVFVAQGIPVRRYFRRPLARNGLVRAFLDLVSLVNQEVDMENLLKVVKSEYFVFSRELADELEKQLLDKRPQLSWTGLGTYPDSEELSGLKPFLASLEDCRQQLSELSLPSDFASWCQRTLMAFLDLKLKSVPARPEDEARLREDGAALASLLNLLVEVSNYCSSLSPSGLTFTHFLEFLGQGISLATYSVTDRRLDAVNLVDALEARQWELPVVFVCGLTEGAFPARIQENLFFNDEERRALNRLGKASFKEAEFLNKEEIYLFYSAVTRAKEKLFLTYPACDARGEKNLPSFFLQDLEELFPPEARPAMFKRRQLSQLVAPPEEALDREELARNLYQAIAQAKEPAPAPLHIWLYNRCRNDFPLKEDLCRLYEGLKWKLGLSPSPLKRPYNATQLAEFAQCPFRHFAGHILRLAELKDPLQTGLDNLRAGSIVHAVLKRYFERQPRPGLADLFEEQFSQETRELPLGLSELSAKEQMQDNLSRFILTEEEFLRSQPYEPREFERPFGYHEAAPLYLEREGGAPIPFAGRIDRLDVGEGTAGTAATVIDYKYGKIPTEAKEIEMMDEAVHLQMALYLLATRRVLNLEPVGAILCGVRDQSKFGIFNKTLWKGGPGSKERQERFHLLEAEDFYRWLKWGEELARQYVAGIESGEIEVRPKDLNRCGPGNCPFAAVCRYEKWWKQE